MSFNRGAIISFLISAFSCNLAFGQTETDPAVQQIIEQLAEELPEDFDFSDLTERLNFYRKNPVEVNRITRDQLQELFFLSPLQIGAFLEHRLSTGNFLSLLELQAIEGFDLQTVQKLNAFVYISDPNSLAGIKAKSLLSRGVNDLMFRYSQYLQQQKGYQQNETDNRRTYLGSPQRLLLRYRYTYGRTISASLNMEKDAGEAFSPPGKIPGFDFNSANIFIKDAGTFKKAVVGDYSLQFGQGLTLWSGLSFGKSAIISSLVKPALGLQPYKSTNETLFFRGLAATFRYKFLDVTTFLSSRKLDAGLELRTDEKPVITSLPQSGLHRTVNEFSNKQAARQTVYGAHLQIRKGNFHSGLTGYHSRFNYDMLPGNSLYNQFYFSGTALGNLGLNYGFTFKNTYVFGEAAYSDNNQIALLNGLMSSISSQVSVVLLHRYYPKNYRSFFNQAVSESSNAINETGFYSGLTVKPNSKWEISAYADLFRFPWLKFGVDAPSFGHELFGQVNYNPTKKTKWVLRYKFEQKQENDDLLNTINTLEDVSRQGYRIEFGSKINKTFSIKNRIEFSNYKKETLRREMGWMIYQDIGFDPAKSKFSANMRLAVFDTPGFNSRIYAYENEVLYSYSVPAYQNSGIRFYLNTRYSVNRKIDLWTKFSVSNYFDLQTIGSGAEQINGSKRSEVKLQLRYQF